MRSDFAAIILTHGRPGKVYTYTSLRRHGYTGRIVVLVDNEDKTVDQYRKKFGDQVAIFDKEGTAQKIDEADNFQDRRVILYARNASFDVAERLGIRYFIQLDDDYTEFEHRFQASGQYRPSAMRKMDQVLEAYLEYFETVPALLSIAFAQGGDFIGGAGKDDRIIPSRKCMNSFICSTDRRFKFAGRINEDVNTYTTVGSRGGLFITVKHCSLVQVPTQKSKGGMTEAYQASGTYVKSFYTVMMMPSAVQVGLIGNVHQRFHHRVTWRNTVPLILPETAKKVLNTRKTRKKASS